MIDIRRILCPIDFSDVSHHALEQAVAIAGWYESRLTVLHVMTPAFFEPPLLFADFAGPVPSAEDRVYLAERVRAWAAAASPPGLNVETLLQQGAPARRILDYADADRSELIVLGTHGRGGFEHLLLGSVSEKVLRKARCPVLTVPCKAASAKLPYRRLLCAVDFSEPSLAAFRFAVSIAQESGAHLTVVHAIEWPLDEDMAALETPEFRGVVEEQARTRVAELVTDEVRTWCEVETAIPYGKPYREILDVAERDAADLIVMGVHGRNALDLMVFGSTTNQVVRRASCPVLTLKQ